MEWILQSKNNKSTEEMVDYVEKELGVKFPRDFVECAKENGGAIPIMKSIDLPHFRGTLLSRLGSFNSKSKSSYILDLQLYEGLPKGLVGIARSEGDLFCYDYNQDLNNPPIVYIHADTDDVYEAFPTFTELLNNLH